MNEMRHRFSLAHLTVMGCPPPEMTHIAARAGYDFVSFRLIPMGVPGEPQYLPGDASLMRATKAALRVTGLRVLDLEVASIREDVEPESYAPAMEAAAEMGAGHVIASAWTGEGTDRNFIVERYAEICDRARPFGLTVDLEFPLFSRLKTLGETVDIVRAADRPNGGVLIDALYYHFARVSLDEIDALPRSWLHFLHVCDTKAAIPATGEGMKHVARDERLYVGEGCIDFAGLLAHLPAIPLSIELPNAQRVKELGYAGHARRCLETARAALDPDFQMNARPAGAAG
jgi:sugar phosphate isomerase/epimerase